MRAQHWAPRDRCFLPQDRNSADDVVSVTETVRNTITWQEFRLRVLFQLKFGKFFCTKKKYIKSLFVSKCNANLSSLSSAYLKKDRTNVRIYRTGYILEQFLTIV